MDTELGANIVVFEVEVVLAVAAVGATCSKKPSTSADPAPTDPSQASTHASSQRKSKSVPNWAALLATLRASRAGTVGESHIQQASEYFQEKDSSLRAKGRILHDFILSFVSSNVSIALDHSLSTLP